MRSPSSLKRSIAVSRRRSARLSCRTDTSSSYTPHSVGIETAEWTPLVGRQLRISSNDTGRIDVIKIRETDGEASPHHGPTTGSVTIGCRKIILASVYCPRSAIVSGHPGLFVA
jgi:hypothetical protein